MAGVPRRFETQVDKYFIGSLRDLSYLAILPGTQCVLEEALPLDSCRTISVAVLLGGGVA